MNARLFTVTILLFGLSGCDKINEITNQAKLNGRAIGAACRHSGRSLEDCFQRNPRFGRADIYAGWREMNEYMMAKKMDIVPPPPDKPAKPVDTVEMGPAAGDDKTEDKDSDKSSDKDNNKKNDKMNEKHDDKDSK